MSELQRRISRNRNVTLLTSPSNKINKSGVRNFFFVNKANSRFDRTENADFIATLIGPENSDNLFLRLGKCLLIIVLDGYCKMNFTNNSKNAH